MLILMGVSMTTEQALRKELLIQEREQLKLKVNHFKEEAERLTYIWRNTERQKEHLDQMIESDEDVIEQMIFEARFD